MQYYDHSYFFYAICADIDECTEGISGCSDDCENSPGYFECSCPSGFTLSHQDNKTCIGKGKNHSLTYSNVHSSHHFVFPNADMT